MADWRKLAQSPEEWADLRYDDPRLDAFAHEVEDRYNLPRGVVEALKNAGERTPSKSSGKPTVSPKGARGIMQFMPDTIKVFKHNTEDPFESIDAAGRYMADVLPRYQGNVLAAIADYNGGPKQAKPVLEGKRPPAQETQLYIERIQQYMEKRYGGNK